MSVEAATDDALTWVFGYGSLLWRPGFRYARRHPARLEGYERAFCRYSFRHRGTPQQPGLVIGLREGAACIGAAFGIPRAHRADALDYLDEREGAGYLREVRPVQLLDGSPPGAATASVPAYVYIPNPAHPSYFGETDPQRLVPLVANGHGESGSALDYLRELLTYLEREGVAEPELHAVLTAAEAHRAGNGGVPSGNGRA